MKSCKILVAPVTPFTSDGEINFDAVGPMARLFLSREVDGFYLCGGTGEGLTLTVEERTQLVECWQASLPSHVPFIVHVGSTSLKESCTLAEHATQTRATGISSIAPPFPAARDLAALTDHFRRIAAAASSLPFYYYHNSDGPGPKIKARDFLDHASSRIPSMAGLKFTHEDLMDLSQCLRFQDGRYDIFYGRDQMLIGALATGARCAVGGTFNILSPLASQVMEAFAAGQIADARTLNDTLVDAISILGRRGGLAAVKAAMSLLGVDCGPMRSPAQTLNAETREKLLEELQNVWPEIAAGTLQSTAEKVPA